MDLLTPEEVQYTLQLRRQASSQRATPVSNLSSPSVHELPLTQPHFNPLPHLSRHHSLGQSSEPSPVSQRSVFGFPDEEIIIPEDTVKDRVTNLEYKAYRTDSSIEKLQETVNEVKDTVSVVKDAIFKLQDSIENIVSGERDRKRRKPQKNIILTAAGKSEAEKSMATRLQSEMRQKLCTLAKLKDGEESVYSGGDDDDDDDDEGEGEKIAYEFNFDMTSTYPQNLKVLERAAQLLASKYRSEHDPEKLIKDGIEFTTQDLLTFATTYFNTRKRRYLATKDEEKKKEEDKHNRTNRRSGRRKTILHDYLNGVQEYKTLYKTTVPEDVLREEHLSDIVSDIDSDDLSDIDGETSVERTDRLESRRKEHNDRIVRAYPHLKEVREIRKKSYRSPELLGLLAKLKQLGIQKNAKGKKKATGATRIPAFDMGRPNERPPSVPVYPFMLNGEWLAKHPPGTRQFEIIGTDPQGFGLNKTASGS